MHPEYTVLLNEYTKQQPCVRNDRLSKEEGQLVK